MTTTLPRPAPARVLAAGAWLKNAACRVDGRTVRWSPLHGDLGTPEACRALQASLRALAAEGPLDAIAHDLHPDFESTRLAQALAAELGVPALPVQHHHAHLAVVQAEVVPDEPLIGLALDGVGLGTDGTAWGGELLWVHGARWQRLGHLGTLALPGGDLAAREPWRMAAALLHALGRGDEIVPRLAPRVGEPLAHGVQAMLARGLNCPATTGAGRWFDAAAGLLGFSDRQAQEAEAAIALERAATEWLADHADPALPDTGLDLRALGHVLADVRHPAEGAAIFHLTLARTLASATVAAARTHGVGLVALGGGCFFNRLLTQRLTDALRAAGLAVHLPQADRGDAGLALGQAWVAAHAMAAGHDTEPMETTACA
ncbi:MAG: carbamoyltransferase HypF [Burkholderiaceae bacterium]|nr:carbamoyltransferase HypF [Rhodoferax sp.]MCP5272892.1 carbamoyltransferase HypF [Burkholderiaceae bacterium]